MDIGTADIALIRQARVGDRESLEELARRAAGPLQAYVFRMTCQDDLTGDIVQETLLEMLRVLEKLQQPEKFWAWLRGIANNKLRRYYRIEKKQRTLTMMKSSEYSQNGTVSEGWHRAAEREREQVVLAAVQSLKPRYRMVLAMRCYEQMDYARIADQMGTSEVGTRMLFSRAKKALARQLARVGLGKSSLPAALLLFGRMTAPSEAAASQLTIPAATLKVGAVAAVGTWLSGKVALLLVLIAGLVGSGAWVFSGSDASGHNPERIDFRPSAAAGPVMQQPGQSDVWFYYPDGAGGPVMMGLTQWDKAHQHVTGRWLQNDRMNYFYDLGHNTVYITNHRMWQDDLSVMRLPGDSAQLSAFLDDFEGVARRTGLPNKGGTDLLVTGRYDMQAGQYGLWAARHYNIRQEEYFKYNFPATATIKDERDDLHKQPWCGFRIHGTLGGREVSGAGRLPLCYAACREQPPRLTLQVGDDAIVDSPREALAISEKGVRHYAGPAFFRYLSRPWEGLHTLDTLRRDAAGDCRYFETDWSDAQTRIQLTVETSDCRVEYTIDMDQDWIEAIRVYEKQGDENIEIGHLQMEYTADVPSLALNRETGNATDMAVLNEAAPADWILAVARGEWP